MSVGLLKGHSPALHEVGHDDGGAARDASHAVDQHIGARQLIRHQLNCYSEERSQVESLVINCRDVEVLDVLGHRLGHVLALAASDNCSDAVGWVRQKYRLGSED